MSLQCSDQVQGEANLVNLVEVVQRKVLVWQLILTDDPRMLGKDVGQLLRDDAADADVVHLPHAPPVVGVSVLLDLYLQHPLQDVLLVDAADVLLDPRVRGHFDFGRLNGHR